MIIFYDAKMFVKHFLFQHCNSIFSMLPLTYLFKGLTSMMTELEDQTEQREILVKSKVN